MSLSCTHSARALSLPCFVALVEKGWKNAREREKEPRAALYRRPVSSQTLS